MRFTTNPAVAILVAAAWLAPQPGAAQIVVPAPAPPTAPIPTAPVAPVPTSSTPIARPAAPASQPATIPIMVPGVGVTSADGRMFGHLPYGEANPADLVPIAVPGFAMGSACRMQRDAAADLTALLETANATPEVAHQLRGISCHRSMMYQRSVFCRTGMLGERCLDAADRARSVGPPGFSEHSTGYAIDFGVRPSPGCPDLDACMASSAAGRWLTGHARDFGFELSFPPGNAQNVTWEPWHWRWVGRNARAPGAARARLIFARARAQFPARPAVDRPLIQLTHARPAPWRLPIPIVWPGLYF